MNGACLSLVLLKELFHFLLEVGCVLLGGRERVQDLLEAHLDVGLRGAVHSHLVAVLLNDLTAVPDLVESERGRGTLEEMTQSR